jgi:hypothetical protein
MTTKEAGPSLACVGDRSMHAFSNRRRIFWPVGISVFQAYGMTVDVYTPHAHRHTVADPGWDREG